MLCRSPLISALFLLRSNLPSSSLTLSSRRLAMTTTSSSSVNGAEGQQHLMLTSLKDAQRYVSQAVVSGCGGSKSVVNCGELACQHDSYLQSLEASSILSYASFEEKAAAPTKKKGKSKEVDESNTNSNKLVSMFSPTRYTIALSDSVFFPEGGGQPADRGVLAINEDISLSVVDAQNINNVCVLTCAAPKDLSHDTIVQALLMSSEDATIKQDIDWDRRFDLMTQHSGQHLISAVALNKFQILTHSFSLGENSLTSYIDFTVDPDVALEQHMATMKQVEELANERIRDNLPMTPTWLDPADPDFETKVRSRLLPAGLTGKIRLMEIWGGVDFNTCCGTHVKTLGALQMIKVFKMEKVKSTVIRVYFAAGKRLAKIMEESYDRQSKFTNMLSCSEEDHVARLSVLLDGKKAKEREIKALKEQLCEFRAKHIVEECKANDQVAVVDLGATDMAFMTLVSASVMQITSSSDGLLLLFVAGADGSDEGSFLLTGDVALVDKFGKSIAELLAGRGGGKNGKFQGKGTKIRSALADAKTALVEGKQT
jgi:misacylated tRNA(Ala) deacylase